MRRAIDDMKQGIELLNKGEIDEALNIDNVFLAIADGQDKAQANLVLRPRACSNPYMV